MNLALWVTQVLLAALFGQAGFLKAFHTQKAKETFHAEDRSDAFVRFVGISEMLGALGMLLPMSTRVLPWLTVLAAIGFALIQVLAILTVHLPNREFKMLPLNAFLLGLALFTIIGRWGLLPF